MSDSDNITCEDFSKYPVILKEYDPNWATIFDIEKHKILNIVGDMIEHVFHIGSTSIPGILSKPTIDILVILSTDVNLDFFCTCMTNAGYICTKTPDKTHKRKNCMNFILPYEIDGVNQYKCYIHIRENGIPYPEVLFARYLREHSDIAYQYQELKQHLQCNYGNDRQGYMIAKSEFIQKYTEIAINEYI